jgi:hypothetical protein
MPRGRFFRAAARPLIAWSRSERVRGGAPGESAPLKKPAAAPHAALTGRQQRVSNDAVKQNVSRKQAASRRLTQQILLLNHCLTRFLLIYCCQGAKNRVCLCRQA